MMNSTYARNYELSGFAPTSPPPEEGLRFGIGFIALTAVCGLVGMALLLSGQEEIVLGIAGFWSVTVVLASPRAGVVLSLSTAVWDLMLNPAEGSGYSWISAGRVLSVLTVASYWARTIGPGRLAIQSPWVRRSTVAFGVFKLWCLFSAGWAIDQLNSLFTFSKVLIHFAFLVVVVDTLSDRKVIWQTLVLMALVSGLGSLAMLVVPGLATVQDSDSRTHFAGTGTNAVSITVGLAVVGCIALLPLRRSLFTIAVTLTTSIPMLLATLRTGTRSVLIGVPLAVAFGACLSYWRKLGRLFLLLLIVGGLSGGSLYWAVQADFITGRLRERLLGVFEADTYETNVRLNLWSEAFELYIKNPIGAGAGNEPLMTEASRGGYGATEAHNTYLSILLEYNVIGLGVILLAMGYLGWGIVRTEDLGLRASAAMLFTFCILSSLKGSQQDTRLFWQPVCLSIAFVEADARRRRAAASPEWPAA
jgi:O-antigen ligase